MQRRRTRSSVQNPLRIPEVLQKILTELPVRDLKSARLVNKFWNSAARTPMQKKCGAKIYYLTSDVDKFLEDTAGGGKCFPCTTFWMTKEIKELYTRQTQGDDINSEAFRKVFETIGAEMTELSLDYGHFQYQWFYAKYLPEGMEFPSLRVLKINFGWFSTYSMSKIEKDNVLLTISKILEKASSLNKVSFVTHNGTEVQLFIDALLVQGGNNLKLTSLEMTATNDNSQWVQLAGLGLNLKSFTVQFLGIDSQWDGNGFDGFNRFLQSQSESLENLLISFSLVFAKLTAWEKPLLEFPNLGKLRALEIIDNLDLLDLSLSYVNFPALKHLKIQRRWYADLIDLKMGPSKSVETLSLPKLPIYCAIYNAAVIFPNIRKLEILVDCKVGRAICHLMLNLEELVIDTTGVPCIDNFITGREPKFSYGDLEARRRMKRWSKKFDNSSLPTGTVGTDLSHLQMLKTLRLLNKDPNQDLEITQLSICLVLLKMKSLRFLDLGYRNNSPEIFLPKRVWKELKKKCDVFWKVKDH